MVILERGLFLRNDCLCEWRSIHIIAHAFWYNELKCSMKLSIQRFVNRANQEGLGGVG